MVPGRHLIATVPSLHPQDKARTYICDAFNLKNKKLNYSYIGSLNDQHMNGFLSKDGSAQSAIPML